MTRIDRGTLTCPKLVEYFVQACKPKESWQVGMEVEKMGVDARTGRPIPYEGVASSVRSVLEELHRLRGGDPIYEGDHLIGIGAPWGTISLEPGGQVEWSSSPRGDLAALRADLDAHLDAMRAAGSALGVRWLDVAVSPEVPVSEMPWMPKARYKIMKSYLGAHGRLAHRMMTQTASIQCAFDFESPEDWSAKFRAAALLAPIAVALFANSSRVDGKDSGYRSFRQAIWRETDPDRCNLPPVVFERSFGIDAWVEWVLDVPTIFTQRGRGLVQSKGAPFRKLLERAGCEAVCMEDWELHLSSIFTEVRSYTYIEARSADLLPDPEIFAVPTFWTGILYHPEVLAAALTLGSGHASHRLWSEAMDQAARKGLDGEAGGHSLRELAERALGLSAWGLRNGGACVGGGDSLSPLRGIAQRGGLRLEERRPG
jgi:glutamate--cysteine ligase